MIAYEDIPERGARAGLGAQWQLLLQCLRRVTDMPVYRVHYTPPDAPLHVIRIIVPSLENHKDSSSQSPLLKRSRA